MYAQAGLSLCWSDLPHCWKSHVTVHIVFSLQYSKNWIILANSDTHVVHKVFVNSNLKLCLLMLSANKTENSFGPDQACQHDRPDLDPNCLTPQRTFIKMLILKKK